MFKRLKDMKVKLKNKKGSFLDRMDRIREMQKPYKRNNLRLKLNPLNKFKYLKGLTNPAFDEYLDTLETTDINIYKFNFPYDCPAKCNISLTNSLSRIF